MSEQVIEAVVYAKNPNSVKLQARKEKKSIGMITVAGDVAKALFELPLGAEITITIKK